VAALGEINNRKAMQLPSYDSRIVQNNEMVTLALNPVEDSTETLYMKKKLSFGVWLVGFKISKACAFVVGPKFQQ
jgi:hypothetical protein